AVDARLRRLREAAADLAIRVQDGPLENASAPPPTGHEEDAARLLHAAARAALASRGTVRRPGVALLAAVDDAVAAHLLRARGRATVARQRVAVVTLLAELARSVPAHCRGDAGRQGGILHRGRRRRDARGALHDGWALAVDELDLPARGTDGAAEGRLSARLRLDQTLA